MKNLRLSALFIILLIILTNPILGQELSEELKILEPLVNKKWSGELKTPDGKMALNTTRTFTSIGDGTIVKYESTTPELNSHSEGFFYYDRSEKKVAVLTVTNRKGIYQKGYVSIEDGILTIQGQISFPERTFDYRNTFEFLADDKVVDRWFQNAFGDWNPGHVIELTAE